MIANRPESLCSSSGSVALSFCSALICSDKVIILWTSGRRYARVLPEPVSDCINASLVSFSIWDIAAFWIAVGVLRFILVSR